MQDTTAQLQPRATFRQWDTVTYDCMDGAVVQVRRHTVALYRSKYTGKVAMGLIDGKAVSVAEAVRVLEGADVTVKTSEVLEQPAHIGKAAAEAQIVRSYAYGQWGMTA